MFAKRGFLPAILICLISLLISLIKFELKLTPKVLAQYPSITEEPTPTTEIFPVVTCKGTSTDNINCNITGGVNKLYILGVTNRSNVNVSQITGVAGLTWTQRLRQCAANNVAYLEIWTAYGSPSDGTINIRFSNTSTAIVGTVTRYSGADPASPVENWTSANTKGIASTQCNTGSGNSNPAVLPVTASTANSLIYVMTNARTDTITAADPDYGQRAYDTAGSGTNTYIHDRVFPSSGVDNVSHTLSGTADWLIAGIVVRPQAVTPTPTKTKIYGWVYEETNNDVDRLTAEAEGLLGGIGFNLYGPINNSTTSQVTPLTGLLGNYRFSNLNDGIYTVDMLSVPGNMTFYPYYTNPQVGIIVNGTDVLVDFPLITITPTGSPTPTDPFPSNTPIPTSDVTPTEQVTPTSIITPPETCLTLPTPELLAPDHDVCLGYKPTFSARVADPNGDNVWSHYFLGDWQINGNIAAATGGLSNFIPSELDLNLSDSFWWTAVTQSSSCPGSGYAPSRLLTLDYTPPAQPEPPVCLLDRQDYVTGESFFTCTWNEPLSSGCGVPVDYRPYFWSTPDDGTLPWAPGWIGNQTSVTVVIEDGRELYAQLIVKDSAGNVSAVSEIGGPFTAPRINYGATPTAGILPTITPTPTNTLTPTPGPWMQLKGGDAYQPAIVQPVPLGKYFLDLMPTPAENPNSIGLVWTNSGYGNFGYGEASPQNWQAEASFTNAYSFGYYWEALKNKAKTVNNYTVGATSATPTPPPGQLIDPALTVYNAANQAYWSAQTDLQSGNTQYGDRTFSFTSVPAEVAGHEWIRTAYASRNSSLNPLVNFTLNADSTVYIAMDNRYPSLPSWMSGWTDSGLDIINNQSPAVTFSLYQKDFPAGSVSLGPVPTSSYSMYTIIVVPMEAAPPPPAEPDTTLNETNSIYSYEGGGYFTLDSTFNGSRTSDPDVTVMLISGTLVISENLVLADPQDIVVFIVNGSIQIDGAVTDLAGLYISSQTVSFVSSNQPITINGMMYAKKFNLGRTYANPDEPAYQFIYQPQYLIRLLPYLGRARINWQDLTP